MMLSNLMEFHNMQANHDSHLESGMGCTEYKGKSAGTKTLCTHQMELKHEFMLHKKNKNKNKKQREGTFVRGPSQFRSPPHATAIEDIY